MNIHKKNNSTSILLYNGHIVLPGMSVCRKIPVAKIDGNMATDEIIRNYLKHQHYYIIIPCKMIIYIT